MKFCAQPKYLLPYGDSSASWFRRNLNQP